MPTEFTLASQSGPYTIHDGDVVFHMRGNVLTSSTTGFVSDPAVPDAYSMRLHIDGQVYSADDAVNLASTKGYGSFTVTVGTSGLLAADYGGDGISIDDHYAYITNNGEIRGGTGIIFDDGEIQNNGIIISTQRDGITARSGGGATQITNTGTITGASDGIEFAAFDTDSGILINSGTITGYSSGVSVGQGFADITNSGTISGGSNGIETEDGNLEINNTGHISGGYSAIRSYKNGLYYIDYDDTVVTLNNSGDIVSNGTAIYLDAGENFYATSNSLILFNSGLIQGVHAAIVVTSSSSTAPNVIENTAAGVIDGSIRLDEGNDQIDNDGLISGDISTYGGDDEITNGGRINGDISTGNNSDRLTNAGGRIDGDISMGDNADRLTNTEGGRINGTVDTGVSADTVTNRGIIDGDVILGDGTDKFDGLGGQVTGRVFGQNGNDTLKGSEIYDDDLSGGGNDDLLMGRAGDDTLNGDRGNDTLKGQKGDDYLNGGKENDILIGGRGDDTLEGGNGSDTFVFARNSGYDEIVDFQDTKDLIDLQALHLSGFGAMAGAITDVAGGVEIDLTLVGGNGTVYIDGITAAQLDAADFIF